MLLYEFQLWEVILITMGLLTAAMVAIAIFRNVPIPHTVVLLILGISIGSMADKFSGLENLLAFQLTPELVLFLFIPALIFASAFNLDSRQLLKDIVPVLIFAIPASLISMTIIGLGLIWAIDIELMMALMFGVLICITDPVATSSLIKNLGAPSRLNALVQGETLLINGTVIVIFNIILGQMLAGAPEISGLGVLALDFVKKFFGGIVIGSLFGVILSEFLYRIRVAVSIYLVMSIVLAYVSFSVSQNIFNVSGVMAVLSSAVVFTARGAGRAPQVTTNTIQEIWKVIALVCNSLLFLLVGLSVEFAEVIANIDIILLAVVFMLLARAVLIYAMVPVTMRLFKLPHVTSGERHVMWWGGVKSGLVIAIVLLIPPELPGRDFVLNLTVGVVLFTLLFNASTVKPMIKFFGIDRLTTDEHSEFNYGLKQAQQHAVELLKKLNDTGLISRSTQQLIQKKSGQVFTGNTEEIDQKQDVRHLYMIAIKLEEEQLKYLYEIGFIQNYIYMDNKNILQRVREERLADPDRKLPKPKEYKPGIFLRFENSLIRRLREHDWATGLLSRYQYLRFSQSIQRDIAGVITATAVLEMLETLTEYDIVYRQQVAEDYRELLQRRNERLRRVKAEFPEFYLRFETQFFAKAALLTGNYYAKQSYQIGEIGSKAYARIERRIRETLTSLPPITSPVPKLKPSDLIGTVPLLNGLSDELLEQLAECAQAVTFLADDIIIGEGEKGDALYIITHGIVSVKKGDNVIAELRDGDFFGEIALLGGQTRMATVKAELPSTILRLSRRDVLSLAESDPDLKLRLQEAEGYRRATIRRQ